MKAGMREKPHYWILHADHSLEPTDDIREWGLMWGDDEKRRVGRTTWDGVVVSTVFLGIDHSHFGKGPPLLFETLVFGGLLADEMDRYATWDEAVAGHAHIVARVTEVCGEPKQREEETL